MNGTSGGQVPFKAIAEAVLDRARRAGLIWRLRPATVTDVSLGGATRVRIDGDPEPIRVASMIGPVAVAARVMVLITPPAGHHIVGWAGPPAPGGGPAGLAWSDSSSPPTANTPLVVLSAAMVLRARTAYRVELGGGVLSSAPGILADLRLARAAADGRPEQALAEFYRYRAEGGSVVNIDGIRYIRRSAGTDLSVTVQLTLQAASGSVTHVAAAGRPRYLMITACGEAAAFPHATDMQ
ncbi:hypothetical protein [Couchioplanes caeruleus]|uniref:Uncharacterized protein n=2 Tax=Couchioplanes caeruleus TaxID=56438 RepID=A0A1K0FRB4_9ACTN|nr:hypothetical protein [Couchioplanes caeruleus]OJF15383.1 hypothetical protein BG844_04590 [Couchioplanes caeruleus subsp. caeruleus]ROP33422.1 hypothetical protein EDD30_6402 [Couchioplanes caeruleus]